MNTTPQVEEVSEVFNNGFTLGKRKSSHENLRSFTPVNSNNNSDNGNRSKISRRHYDKLVASRPTISLNNVPTNNFGGITHSPVNFDNNMYVSQQQQFSVHYNNNNNNNNIKIGMYENNLIQQRQQQQNRKNIYNTNINMDMEDDDSMMSLNSNNENNNEKQSKFSKQNDNNNNNNILLYKQQQVARRRRRANVSLFSKPWVAYPSIEERQKNDEKIIKDGFKRRRTMKRL